MILGLNERVGSGYERSRWYRNFCLECYQGEDIDFIFPVEIDYHVLADVAYRDFTTPRMLLFRCQGKSLSWCREHGFQFLLSSEKTRH